MCRFDSGYALTSRPCRAAFLLVGVRAHRRHRFRALPPPTRAILRRVRIGPGETFGRYTIELTIGIGGMGQVFRAFDNLLERVVAIKIIRPDTTEREEATARFFREARLAAKLTHPNTIQVYDLGEVDGVPFIAMEYLNGKQLTTHCGNPAVRPDRKVRWLLDMARGLAAAHRLQMVHRDVKPGNAIVSEDDVVKVLDFGLAKRVVTTAEVRKTFNTDLGFIVGTPAYMAPEQLVGEVVDARCDQFAWGITAYVLLTGHNPRGTDPLLVEPIAPLGAEYGVTPGIASVLARAVDRDRDRRYPNMDTLITELDAALAGARDVVTTGAFPSRPVARPPSNVPQPSLAPGRDDRATDPRPFRLTMHPSTPSEERLRAATAVTSTETNTLGAEAWQTSTGPAPPLSQVTGWRFDRRVDPRGLAPLFAAAFAPDGLRALAFGPSGILVYDRGRWVDHPPHPEWFRPEDVWAATSARDGSIFVAGRGALLARILPDGTMHRWLPPANMQDVWLRGIEVTEHGWLTTVGAAAGGTGVIGWIGRSGLVFKPFPHSLHAVCTVESLGQIACGAHGTVALVTRERDEVRAIGHGDLLSVAALGRGAVVVGVDAQVYNVTDRLEARVEATETESSLAVVTKADDESAWAGSTRARQASGGRCGPPSGGSSRDRRPRSRSTSSAEQRPPCSRTASSCAALLAPSPAARV